MKGDDIKQEFEMLIKKEVATLKETLLETFEKVNKKSYKRKLILSRKKILN